MNPGTATNCSYCGIPTQGDFYCCRACEILATQVKEMPVLAVAKNPFSYLDQKEFRDLCLAFFFPEV